MRVRVSEVRKGLHPSEVVVSVKTVSGEELVTVSRRSLQESSLDVGYPISVENDDYLIELPRETARGSSRVWVKAETLDERELVAAHG